MSALPLLQPQLRQQIQLFEPAQYLDDSHARNTFAILRAMEDGKKRQKSYPTECLYLVMDMIQREQKQLDTWISQCEFWANTRRLVHLARMGLQFADLDTYTVGITGSPEKQTAQLLRVCRELGLPEPSIVVFSGRGLQAKWLLVDAVPSQALPRWNAIQRVIVERLEEMGADVKAKDASRVLRLVQTTNTKTGQTVRITHHNPTRYAFDTLAKDLLPLTRKEQPREWSEDSRNVFLLRPSHGEKRGLVAGQNTSGLRQFMGFQLAWDRLSDLRRLHEIRMFNGTPREEGHSDTFVFLGAVFLAQALVHLPRFHDELKALAREFAPHWSEAQVRSCASSVLARLRGFIAGNRIDVNGRKVDPRYRFRNETLIDGDWLGITPEEEKSLQTIISEPEAKRRDALRARQKRSDAGAMTRQEYEGNAEQKRATARILKAQGSSWAEIALELGYKNARAARMSCAV